MFTHNLRSVFRSLIKNRFFSAMNIMGFAVGFAVCIIIAIYAYNEYSVNAFFPDSKNIYRLVDVKNETTKIDNAVVPLLKDQFPEIKEVISLAYARMDDGTLFIKSGEYSFEMQDVMATTNAFFDFADVKPVRSKSNRLFADKNSVVISESAALKMFGTTDVIDRAVTFFTFEMTISAVVEDLPSNSTIGADFYFNDENAEIGFMQNCYSENNCYLIRDIYFSLNSGTDINRLIRKMSADFPANRTKTSVVSYEPLRSIYFSDKSNDFDMDKRGNKAMLWIFITIAVLTLVMSVFNYENHTISKQLRTLKFSGIRITNGAGISQLRSYYLIEAGVSILLSLILAVLISMLALPLAEKILNTTLSFAWLLKPEVFGILLLLLLVTIALSTLFPVSLISRLNVSTLLGRNSPKFSANSLSRLMSVAQIVISVILLSGLLLVNKQLDYVKHADIGFQKEHLLRIDLPYSLENHETIKNEFGKLPFVKDLTYTSNGPGSGWSRSSVDGEAGKSIDVRTMSIEDNFLKTFGMRLIEGREPLSGEMNHAALLTESAYKALGWSDFRGKQAFGMDVVGIVNDLNINSLHTGLEPVGFRYSNKYFSALNVRLAPGNVPEQMKQLKSTWKALGIDDPFSFEFFDVYYNSLYQKEDRQAKALTVFSFIAFIITSLGLLGQIMQLTERKVKEIGIRKINGAKIREVITLLNREFILSVILAIVIATPVTWYAMHKWLENFAYKTALSWWVFALGGLITLAIVLLTVSWQSYRAATRNPVEALRYE